MRYRGSKNRFAYGILNAINKIHKLSSVSNWIEPFVGGCGMLRHIHMIPNKVGSDLNAYLIHLLVGIQHGWLPTYITKERYEFLKQLSSSSISFNGEYDPLFCEVAYAGIYFSSFTWYGPYLTGRFNGYSFPSALREFHKLRSSIKDCKFFFFEIIAILNCRIKKTIVYMDPPYFKVGKNLYKSYIDIPEFWTFCESLVSLGYPVFVSEYVAPNHWECVYQKSYYTRNVVKQNSSCPIRTEKLFYLGK